MFFIKQLTLLLYFSLFVRFIFENTILDFFGIFESLNFLIKFNWDWEAFESPFFKRILRNKSTFKYK